ncbi:hypothetical protein [Spirosoma validum]|uniref:Uncharacterized protein n=1 Tax=Spirosoma validum TaxID=2771355 RepID=A0A927B9F9_9BACT|nr:hypothetical protein [Spirosoma validum]MBD2757708.1 hypothetical protein [Spirosoma validum]
MTYPSSYPLTRPPRRGLQFPHFPKAAPGRLPDIIGQLIVYSGLLALLCYLLWWNGYYQARLDRPNDPTKARLHCPANE